MYRCLTAWRISTVAARCVRRRRPSSLSGTSPASWPNVSLNPLKSVDVEHGHAQRALNALGGEERQHAQDRLVEDDRQEGSAPEPVVPHPVEGSHSPVGGERFIRERPGAPTNLDFLTLRGLRVPRLPVAE